METYSQFGDLIKWPQCVIVGKKVTVEQAKEILARTDMFFDGFSGNRIEWNDKVYESLGYPKWGKDSTEHYMDYLARKDKFFEKHNYIQLEYLTNEYISSCYVGGVHGWCHPNGEIRYWDNIGKYPTWEEIEDDCKKIAEAFPFLDMKVCLYNQESCGEQYYDYPKECVGGFKIENGSVRCLTKDEYIDPNSEYCQPSYKTIEEHKKQIFDKKHEIFGNKMDKSIFVDSAMELFFSEDEFKEYFDGYYY